MFPKSDRTHLQALRSGGLIDPGPFHYVKKVGGYYEFHSAVDQRYVIDLRSSNAVSGENIHCWEENGTNAQRWILERVGNVKIMKL